MMIACYDTVSESFPEESLTEMKDKYKSMNKLLKTCDRLKIDRAEIDLIPFYDLRKSILKSQD